ncbi:transposase [Ochrobactrum quorumnocens]|uniref:transposase n=1 Tax=Ochrobactrum quorumnocens TaxID=271865 RepID=UPI0038541A7C
MKPPIANSLQASWKRAHKLDTARKAGAIPVIPYRSNRRNIPKHFAVALYRGRARIEQMMGKLKRFKRVALRCEKQQETSDPSSQSLLLSS